VPLSPPSLVFTYGKLDQHRSFVEVTGGGNCALANTRAVKGVEWMNKREINEVILRPIPSG
jgi:DNA (cytosine-5)-methyltransferase 1